MRQDSETAPDRAIRSGTAATGDAIGRCSQCGRGRLGRLLPFALAGVLLAGCATELTVPLDELKPGEVAESTATELAPGTGRPADVEAIAWRALVSQADIASAAQQVESAIQTARAATGDYLPQISAGMEAGMSTSGNTEPALTLTGSQMLYDFGALDRSVQQSVLRARIAHLDFLDNVDDLLQEVVASYSGLEKARAQLSVTGARLTRMQELEQLIVNRQAEGIASAPDLLDARREVQSSEALHLKAQVELARAERNLSTLAGPQALTLHGPVSGLASACRGDGLQLEGIPSVERAGLTRLAAELAVENAAKSGLPSVSLVADASQPVSGFSHPSPQVGFGLDISSALFRGGSRKAELAAAQNSLKAAAAALRASQQDAGLAWSNAMDEVRNLGVMRDALERQVAGLDEMRGLYQSQFLELGTRNLREVLDIEAEYFDARLDLLATRAEIEAAQVACLREAGVLRRHFHLEDKTLHGLRLTP